MIKPFSSDDLEDVKEIINRCFDESIIIEEKARQYIKKRYMEDGYFLKETSKYPIFVYKKDEKAIAIGSIKGNMIKKIYVHPDEQGKGIGKELLHYLERIAFKDGYKETMLDSYDNSLNFYISQGYFIYKKFVRKWNGVNIPITIMKKKINK